MTVAITKCCDECCEEEQINGTNTIAKGSTMKLAAMIQALRETSSTWELVADVANEFICNEISNISMITNLSQKNSPEASQNCAFPAITKFTLFIKNTLQQLQKSQHLTSLPFVVFENDVIFLERLIVLSISSVGAIIINPPKKQRKETNKYIARHTKNVILIVALLVATAALYK